MTAAILIALLALVACYMIGVEVLHLRWRVWDAERRRDRATSRLVRARLEFYRR